MSLLTVTLSHFPDTFTPAPQEHRAPLFPTIFRSHTCITTPFFLKFYYDDSHYSALSQHIISSVFLFRLIIISPASPLLLNLNMGQPDNISNLASNLSSSRKCANYSLFSFFLTVKHKWCARQRGQVSLKYVFLE